MCKYLIIIILLFDGTLVKEKLEFSRPIDVQECLKYATDHREQISKYFEKKNIWLLNDGRGTFQGFICE